MTMTTERKVQRDNVLVAVRVRTHDNQDSAVDVSEKTLTLHAPKYGYSGIGPHQFSFDKCYCPTGDNPASQEDIFHDLGDIALQNAFSGFNVTILAYGQTGSGKSYCMMGRPSDPGLIPRISKELFSQIAQRSSETEGLTFTCEASYFEIYNEKVRDLLDPKKMEGLGSGGLPVREHPKHGPYVEDLSIIPVQSFEDIDSLMSQGNSARTVAATRMNAESSRSHAIFTLRLKQRAKKKQEGVVCEKISHMHLVDLAGSERQTKTKAQGVNLKEAAEINKSLVTLGRVISALAESKPTTPSRTVGHIPFRDSTLTWLLKSSFGINGNSRTMLLCTISSREADYEESLGSLRYAARAKRIVTSAICNEDSNKKLVDSLKSDIKELTAKLGSAEKTSSQEIQLLNEQLKQAQKLIDAMNMSWEDKVKRAEEIRIDREAALQREGIAIKMDPCSPFLCNLNEDPGVSECLIYYLKKGDTYVGRSKALPQPSIFLHDNSGPELVCLIKTMNDCTSILIPQEGADCIYVNGQNIVQDVVLTHGDRVIIGAKVAFQYSASMNSLQKNPAQNRPEVSWQFAQTELKARLESVMVDLEKERDQVKLLEVTAAKSGEQYTNVLKELENERANKLRLSEELRLAVEEGKKTKKHLEVSKTGFATINETQKRQLSEMKKELKREQSMREGLSRIVDRIRNDQITPALSMFTHIDLGPCVRRLITQAISIWRLSSLNMNGKVLEDLSAKVVQCNSMAHSLSHEVYFEIVPHVKLSDTTSSPSFEMAPIIRMRSVSVPIITLPKIDFINLYHRIREFYCHYSEEHDGRKQNGSLDPIEYLKAHPSQLSEVGFGIIYRLSSIMFNIDEIEDSCSIFNGNGQQIGCLLFRIPERVSVPDQDSPFTVEFHIIGITLNQSDAKQAHRVSVTISLPSVVSEKLQLEFEDIPILSMFPVHMDTLKGVCASLTISSLKNDLFETPLRARIMMGNPSPETMDCSDHIWENARSRYQSLKRVSLIKTPSIGLDGSICVPGPSPRLVVARAFNGSETNRSTACDSTISDSLHNRAESQACSSSVAADDQSVGSRIHVLVEVQELSSTGAYNNCSIKDSADNGTIFRVCLNKPKRFQVRIIQADTKHFSLESCSMLSVVSIRCGSLRDSTVFNCDITQEQAHVHDRYLTFRCAWPADLANHSYAQRSSRFELDIEIMLYVDWFTEPIVICHTVFCKAYARRGILRSLMDNISETKRHSGVFCALRPIANAKFYSDLIRVSKAIQTNLTWKHRLEKARCSLSFQSCSPSESFFKASLELLHRRKNTRTTMMKSVPYLKLSIKQCSDNASQPERTGFLHHGQRRVFCVLRYPFLQFFKNTTQKCEEESIDLAGATVHVDRNAQQPFSFSLCSKARTYILQASCQEDLQQWIHCLSMYLSCNND